MDAEEWDILLEDLNSVEGWENWLAGSGLGLIEFEEEVAVVVSWMTMVVL
jgi:hypothetical protein